MTSRKRQPPRWHVSYQIRAQREGWGILVFTTVPKSSRIAAMKDTTLYREGEHYSLADERAQEWVHEKADEGSVFHRKALAYLAACVITG